MAEDDGLKGLEVREYRPGDEPGIIDLMKDHWTYLKSPDALRRWTWLYTGSAYGKALVILGTHSQKIVGHYAMFPLMMRIGKDVVRGGKAEGSAIHEDYRGNIAPKLGLGVPEYRLFGDLVSTLFDSATKRGAKLVWGFPNDAALKPQVRAGYSYHAIEVDSRVLPFDCKRSAELVYSRAPLSPAPKKLLIIAGRIYCRLMTIGRGSGKGSIPPGFSAKRITSSDLDQRYREFLGRCTSLAGVVTVEREPDYVRWRFLDNPVVPHEVYVSENSGRITAMVVTDLSEKDGIKGANIVDMIGAEGADEDLLALIKDVVARKKAEGCACIRTWMSDCMLAKRHLRILRRAGFIRMPTAVRRRRLHLIYKMLDKSMDAAFMDKPENWYITIAFTEGTA